jgi:hypothetical protein
MLISYLHLTISLAKLNESPLASFIDIIDYYNSIRAGMAGMALVSTRRRGSHYRKTPGVALGLIPG